MKESKMNEMWKSYDDKLDQVLSLNKEIVSELTHGKLNRTVQQMVLPKTLTFIIGIPFILLFYLLAFIGFKAQAIFVALGFGCISLITSALMIAYLYHLHLIRKIRVSDNVVEVQKSLAELKMASFNTLRIAIFQIPFWAICWMSYDALMASPLIYGGVNALIFVGFCYLSYWLYKRLDINDIDNSKVSQFFFSGVEWTPIIQASSILDQLKEYQKEQ